MRKTTEFLIAHLIEPLALIVESYIIHVTKDISDLATAGHWELLDQMIRSPSDLDYALFGASYSGSIELVQHILDRGVTECGYEYGILNACINNNLDAAKLILEHYRHSESEIELGLSCSFMIDFGELVNSIEMFTWICDEFNPGPYLMGRMIEGALKSANQLMISAASSRGGKVHACMMYEAAYSGSHAMIELFPNLTVRDYDHMFTGACWGGKLELVKWLMQRGATSFDHGFSNAREHIDVLKWLVANVPISNAPISNAPISNDTFTWALLVNIHKKYTCEYERRLVAATKIHPDDRESANAIIRWIMTEHSDNIDHAKRCQICGKTTRNHIRRVTIASL